MIACGFGMLTARDSIRKSRLAGWLRSSYFDRPTFAAALNVDGPSAGIDRHVSALVIALDVDLAIAEVNLHGTPATIAVRTDVDAAVLPDFVQVRKTHVVQSVEFLVLARADQVKGSP